MRSELHILSSDCSVLFMGFKFCACIKKILAEHYSSSLSLLKYDAHSPHSTNSSSSSSPYTVAYAVWVLNVGSWKRFLSRQQISAITESGNAFPLYLKTNVTNLLFVKKESVTLNRKARLFGEIFLLAHPIQLEADG